MVNENILVTDISDFDNYIKNIDSKTDYNCNIFPTSDDIPTIFPKGTLSYIGARTGRGKTTALVSISMDALNQEKNVLFVTSEESPNQILLRMILNQFFNSGDLKWKTFLLTRKTNARLEAKEILKNGNSNNFSNDNDKKEFIEKLFESKAKIENLLKSKKFIICNGLKAKTFEEITNEISNVQEGSVVIIDYIQHLRTPKGFENATRQMQIQEASHRISDLVANNGLICIAGAQFGRTEEDKKANQSDTLAEGLFRESGDIEQDAHIAIGIGKYQIDNSNKIRFYSVIKSRENETNNKKYNLLDAFSYSHTEVIKSNIGLYEYNEEKIFKAKKKKILEEQKSVSSQNSEFSDIHPKSKTGK